MPLVDPDAALARWRQTDGGSATLINLSENHCFRVDAEGGRHILRLHRPGYQSTAAIESELAWLAALGGGTDLPLPRPVPGCDGEMVQQIGDRYAVLFTYIEGREASEADDLPALFRFLGEAAAHTHNHAERWSPPTAFVRPRLDLTLLDPDGSWGDWRMAPGVEPIRPLLDALDRRLREQLDAYGMAAGRFGLIHADMRLANVLVGGGGTALIDFDDCGFGWHLYDLAASLSFIDTRADVPELVAAWVAGYSDCRPLAAADMAMIEPMILFRRMVLLAWIGSHSETELARLHVGDFAGTTGRLADRYLGGRV